MTECPNCHSHDMYGVMYAETSPNYNPHGDHISSYQCGSCGKTFGRWTRKELDRVDDGTGPVQYAEEKVWGGAPTDPEKEEIGGPEPKAPNV